MRHCKYGYPDKVKQDVKQLNEILLRQGISLLIDVIAEHIGKVSQVFKLNTDENTRILNSTLKELKDAINERI